MVALASDPTQRSFVDYQFVKMGFRDAYATLPVERLGWLLYEHLVERAASRVTDKESKAEFEQWVADVNAPLSNGSSYQYSDEALQVVIDSGFAADLGEAQDFLAHQARLETITDPAKRHAENVAYQMKRSNRPGQQ